jgi:hypothetical protein
LRKRRIIGSRCRTGVSHSRVQFNPHRCKRRHGQPSVKVGSHPRHRLVPKLVGPEIGIFSLKLDRDICAFVFVKGDVQFGDSSTLGVLRVALEDFYIQS